jgi:hypothetical protein
MMNLNQSFSTLAEFLDSCMGSKPQTHKFIGCRVGDGRDFATPSLMHPALVGDLAHMKLSTKMLVPVARLLDS